MESKEKQYGVLNLIWDVRDCTALSDDPMARHLLLVLSACTNAKKKFEASPSIDLLARHMGASKRSVSRKLKVLEESGLITIRHRFDDTCVFFPNLPRIKASALAWRSLRQRFKEENDLENEVCELEGTSEKPIDSNAPTFLSACLDYSQLISNEVLKHRIFAGSEASEKSKKYAMEICKEFPGSAPIIALSLISPKQFEESAKKDNPPGYLRKLLKIKVPEIRGEHRQITPEIAARFEAENEEIRGEILAGKTDQAFNLGVRFQ